MTYSIVARCPRTGQLGIGVASFSMAIGRYCDGAVRSNIGVLTNVREDHQDVMGETLPEIAR